jgi:antitoxin (DNA-binding transcriptional repressor) of toxin-antitoxin stability system
VIVARGRHPVARLVPCAPASAKREFGALKGLIDVGPAFFDPLPPEELEAWEQ